MACAAAGLPQDRFGGSHPYDPADFNRCLLLLEKAPEIRKHFNKVSDVSETWKKLIDRWDEVEKTFIDEVGYNWSKCDSAPKTYELMKSIGC